MTIRLNQADRNSIQYKALQGAFDKEREKMRKEEDKLGMEGYRAVFTPAIRKAAKSMPKGWLRMDSCLRFNAGGWTVQFNVKESQPVPSDNGYCRQLGILTGDLADRMQAYQKRKKDQEEKENKIKVDLSAMLNRMNTLKQLEENWPEGEKFYAFLRGRGGDKAALPAVQVSSINQALGLTKAEKETA